MKKRIATIALVVALLATCFGATLAYFTDAKAETNVFTVGNVKIELIESYVHRGAATGYENIEGYPEVASGEHTDKQILDASGEAYDEYLAAQQLMPGIGINKMPYVKNTGKSDAYVRIRVMIPTALNIPTMNSSEICTTALEEEFSRPAGVDLYAVDGTANVGGVDYDVYTFIRKEALKPEEMTKWNVWNTVRMDDDVTSEELAALITAGAITEAGQFNVLVQADAIQAASFKDATEAFAAFDAQK